MPRRQVALQPLQHAPAFDVGQENIERDGVRVVFAGQRKRGSTERGYEALHPLLAGRIEQESGKTDVIFDNQQDLIARLNVVAVVVSFVDELDFGRRSGHRLKQTWRSAVALADR